MSFLNHSFVLLLLQEVLGYTPKIPLVFEKTYPEGEDVTAWYHQSGIHPRVSQIWVMFQYHAISPALKEWKYKKNITAKKFILSAFQEGLSELPNFSKESYVVPIPLGIDRWFERGFNQTVGLSKIAKKTLSVGYFPWCFRWWSGKHQSTLSKKERQSRVVKFWIPPFISVPKHIILIDDVISTGSTLQSCAQYLIERGCKRITVIALSRSS